MKIAILLSTYNGSAYLRQQLDSLCDQSHKEIDIFVRDDGSTDDTLKILSDYNLVKLPCSQNLGSKNSFAALLNYAVTHSNAKYFMFCDQDDVWQKSKVEKTLNKIIAMENRYGLIPILVHTDLEVVDDALNSLSTSMWDYEYILPSKNSFSRLLIQNTVTGCTSMLNRQLAEKCLDIPEKAIMHDWWVGLVASCFGRIGYINEPTIKYRQHGANAIGVKKYNVSIAMFFLSLCKAMFHKDEIMLASLKVNIEQGKAFLESFDLELNIKTKNILIQFVDLDKKSFFRRRWLLLKYRLLKQGVIRNIGLLFNV